MSLVTVSDKRNRVYHRLFDHDEARRLRGEGWTYQALADRFGVSEQAVLRVCDTRVNERMRRHTAEYLRSQRQPCKGECGAMVWMHASNRSGYCVQCLAKSKVADDVRETELRCTKCREWKPDDAFPTYRARRSRRGRSSSCRACETAARRAYRHAHPDKTKAGNQRAFRKRRERKVATTYVVLRPNGNGYVEQCRVEAGSPAHAIEQAAQEEGEYVAVAEGKFQVMKVGAVQAFRVVPT